MRLSYTKSLRRYLEDASFFFCFFCSNNLVLDFEQRRQSCLAADLDTLKHEIGQKDGDSNPLVYSTNEGLVNARLMLRRKPRGRGEGFGDDSYDMA